MAIWPRSPRPMTAGLAPCLQDALGLSLGDDLAHQVRPGQGLAQQGLLGQFQHVLLSAHADQGGPRCNQHLRSPGMGRRRHLDQSQFTGFVVLEDLLQLALSVYLLEPLKSRGKRCTLTNPSLSDKMCVV